MSALKPILRELKDAALKGGAHAKDKLHQLTDNLDGHLDDVIRQVRHNDTYDGPNGPDGHAPDDATARGWWKNRALRRGSKTDAGWHFLPDKDRDAAGDVPLYPGEYTLDLHGTPNAVQGGDGSMMDATDFAEHVRNRTDWDGQSPIRLFSCDTGSSPDGFAQQLADNLGVDVTAPTKPVWSSSSGSPFVTDVDPITGGPVWPPNGGWVVFQSNG